MVFGFGKKKTREQPSVPVKEARSLSLEDIPGIIQEVEEPIIMDAVSVAKSTRDEVDGIRKKIRELITHLESDDLKLDDVDRNLGTIVKRGKDSVVSVIKKETMVDMTFPAKYDQAVLLNTEISQLLKKIGDVLGINSRIIHIFAKKYADSLKEEIARIASSRNRLQAAVNNVEDFRAKGKTISDLSQKIQEHRITSVQKKERIEEIDSEIISLKNKVSDLERDIDKMRTGDKYAKFLEIKNKMDSTSAEKSDIKGAMDFQFAKISRPLGRYSYISSFEKPVRKMMDDLLANPYDIVSKSNKESIVQILEAVEKAVVSGSVSVKDSEKSLEQIQETISRLDEFISLKESYFDKVASLKKDLSIFDIEALEAKERDLKKAVDDIASMEAIREKLEEEARDNEQALLKNIEEIESAISQMVGYKAVLNQRSSKIN